MMPDAKNQIKADCERDAVRGWTPCAYPQPGRICGAPAIGYDVEHGWVLCQEHLEEYLRRQGS